MSSIQGLRERVSALKKEANNLLANKGDQVWSKDDQVKFDGLMEEADRANAQASALQRQIDDEAKENFTPAKAKAGNDGPSAFEIFARYSTKEMSAEQVQTVRNAMSTTTGAEGGFTTSPELQKQWIETLKSFGYMRAVAGQVTTETGVDMNWPTTNGTAEKGEIVAQNSPASPGDVAFGTRKLQVQKFSSKVITIPFELLQDTSINIQALIYQRMRDRIGRIQNERFTLGTGTDEPMGLVPAAAVGKVGATGQAATITYDDLVDMVDSVDMAYLDAPESTTGRAGTATGWMFGQAMRRAVRKLKDGNGRPLWTPGYDEGVTQGVPDRLMGRPVYINNDMPAPGANAKSLAFGDFGKYLIRDAMQFTLFRFEDSAYTIKGQVGFLAWSRAGGNLMDLDAVRIYQHSAS